MKLFKINKLNDFRFFRERLKWNKDQQGFRIKKESIKNFFMIKFLKIW